MNIPEPTDKAVFSVVEVASLCQLSKSQFHVHIKKKVFPPPILSESCKRPYYTHELAYKCVEIRRTGIGFSGQVVLFNRKPTKTVNRKKATAPATFNEIVEAVKSLGINVTAEAVTVAIAKLFPEGVEGHDQGDVIRKVFLHLQAKK